MLVATEDFFPEYCPAALFEASPLEMDPRWKLKLEDAIRTDTRKVFHTPIQAWLGFPELMGQQNHDKLIIDCDEDLLKVFHTLAGKEISLPPES